MAASAYPSSTALPAWKTTPSAPIARPRRSAWASVSADRSTVLAVGEPRLTSRDAWMKTGTPRSPQPSRNATSWAGSPGGSAQPRELDT